MKKREQFLTDDQKIKFLRNNEVRDNGVIAVEMANEILDKGGSLKDVLKKDSEGYGAYFRIKKLYDRNYNISFGNIAGPTLGDEGNWDVEIDENGEFVNIAYSGGRIY